jgi:hypothetical protein
MREYATNKSPAANLRFGATAAVPRMNLSCEIELPCAAEMAVEAAAAPSRWVVGCNARECVEKESVSKRKCEKCCQNYKNIKKCCNFAVLKM